MLYLYSIGLCMILISTYGRRNLPLLAEHTKERIWRQVWALAPSLPSIIIPWLSSMIMLHHFIIWHVICSLKVEEARPWSVVIICHILTQKILLFHVLYTATATGLWRTLIYFYWWKNSIIIFFLCYYYSGCRADANEAVTVLLPANITVFTLDFSGSGLSEGNYVSLGWHEVRLYSRQLSLLAKNWRTVALLSNPLNILFYTTERRP